MNKTTAFNSQTLPDQNYGDCFSIGLPSSAAALAAVASAAGIASNGSRELNNAPTQSLTLNKVKVQGIMDCFATDGNSKRTLNEVGARQSGHEPEPPAAGIRDKGEDYSNLICVSGEPTRAQSSTPTAVQGDDNHGQTAAGAAASHHQRAETTASRNDDSMRVLICSTTQTSRSR